MKFSTREDIEAPVEHVYDVLSDIDGWERNALRRGAELRRSDTLTTLGPGMAWSIAFDYRGRKRTLDITATEIVPNETMVFSGMSAPVDGFLSLDLAEMGLRRTRLIVGLEIRPRTLAARLFIQSLRLAKRKLDRRFAQRVAVICGDIEARYRVAQRA
ncbi:MAG: SRPBCC family protein [Pseudorhodobacter sp.]